MSPEIAQRVVIGITLTGAVVWLFSLSYLGKSAQLRGNVRAEGLDEPPVQNCLAGCAEVEGATKTLAAKAAAILARGTLGSVKIVDKTDDRIVFERVDSGIANAPAGRWFRRGELRFTPLHHNRTQVEWTVEPANFRWLIAVGSIVQLVGLIALVTGCWTMLTFVASSPEPAVRWQSLQMLQVVHVLWPPFLFAGLYRKGIRGIAAEFETLANNLPYLGEQP